MVGLVELPACDEAELIEQVQDGRERPAAPPDPGKKP